MIQAPTKYQRSAIEEKVRAYTNLLSESLESIKLNDAKATFVALLDLICLDLNSYDNDTKKLPIGEAVAQEDLLLRIQIQSLLPESVDKDDLGTVYTVVYTLFHEYRLNKSPDCPYADDNNSAVLARGGEHIYAQTYQKTGTLAARCKRDGVQLSDAVIGDIVVSILKGIKEEAMKSIKPAVLPRPPEVAKSEKKRASKDRDADQDADQELFDVDRSEAAILPQFKTKKIKINLGIKNNSIVTLRRGYSKKTKIGPLHWRCSENIFKFLGSFQACRDEQSLMLH